ncbi:MULTISPECIES: acetyl-CoA carboxylase biotin carboxyl carrier protein [Bacillus]|uniref:acetyl-CoA carboxylase biotin carboxyl carrier protein n=1 Tax=Bacillus TaxID=1386 RepID=UPI0002F330DA|nr:MULTISPECIES: acetyl-CoA carboxylase biotin carboxyl carrier protein [Bacillus]
MLKVQEIREIIKLVDGSSIQEFVFEQDGTKIKLKKNDGTVVTVPAVQPQAQVQVAPVVEAEPVKEVKEVKPAVEAAPVKEAAPVEEDLHQIVSPMVGTFYASPSPDAEAYVKVGSKVGEEDVVCIVEAMKLFNEINAEVKGEIVEILAKDGQLVEYGQPLFLVRAE